MSIKVPWLLAGRVELPSPVSRTIGFPFDGSIWPLTNSSVGLQPRSREIALGLRESPVILNAAHEWWRNGIEDRMVPNFKGSTQGNAGNAERLNVWLISPREGSSAEAGFRSLFLERRRCYKVDCHLRT